MAILIKRYANRKLYNTDTSRYITLKGIATLLDAGEEVRVVDNESGEDITQVALSQILVGNKRARQEPSDTLLTQILSRGGDALYGAIRRSVDDASEGLGEFQDRFRQMVGHTDANSRAGLGFAWDQRQKTDPDSARDSEPADSADLSEVVRASVARAIESLDLPRRRDIEELSRSFERVASAVERLERAYLPGKDVSTQASSRSNQDTSE